MTEIKRAFILGFSSNMLCTTFQAKNICKHCVKSGIHYKWKFPGSDNISLHPAYFGHTWSALRAVRLALWWRVPFSNCICIWHWYRNCLLQYCYFHQILPLLVGNFENYPWIGVGSSCFSGWVDTSGKAACGMVGGLFGRLGVFTHWFISVQGIVWPLSLDSSQTFIVASCRSGGLWNITGKWPLPVIQPTSAVDGFS